MNESRVSRVSPARSPAKKCQPRSSVISRPAYHGVSRTFTPSSRRVPVARQYWPSRGRPAPPPLLARPAVDPDPVPDPVLGVLHVLPVEVVDGVGEPELADEK